VQRVHIEIAGTAKHLIINDFSGLSEDPDECPALVTFWSIVGKIAVAYQNAVFPVQPPLSWH
jgi:hypothetical protein